MSESGLRPHPSAAFRHPIRYSPRFAGPGLGDQSGKDLVRSGRILVILTYNKAMGLVVKVLAVFVIAFAPYSFARQQRPKTPTDGPLRDLRHPKLNWGAKNL